MKVFLVRHAQASDRDRWRGDDRSRPLTDKGQAQARGLVTALSDEAVDQVLSSPYLRCLETVEPIARVRKLSVKTERLLAEGSDWRETLDLICDSHRPTVMCSQGDVIGGIIASLVDRGLLVADAARWQKGSTWILEVGGGAVRAATYLMPREA